METLKRAFLVLLLSGAALVQAKEPAYQIPQVRYAKNDDLFYQEQYRDLLAVTKHLLPSALYDVFKSETFSEDIDLGPVFEFNAPILVEIKVIPEESLYHGLQATAGWEQVDGQWVHALTLNIAVYIENPKEDLETVIRHELAHIVVADIIGLQETAAVPIWLNEGIAQSVTNEGRSRVSDLAGSLGWKTAMLQSCQLDAPIDAFAHGESNFECYPNYYLATQRLQQIGGPRTLDRMLRALRSGQKTPAAFQSATGKDYSFFQQDVDAFMADVITDRKPIP